jgi:hypothetical protein
MTGLMFVTVKEFEWGNPQNQIYFEVTDLAVECGNRTPCVNVRALLDKEVGWPWGTRSRFGEPPKIAGTWDPAKDRLDFVSASHKPFTM